MDFTFENRRLPKRGDVLVADPFSKNDYFGRSIVYICDHNKDGTFGFVINNYLSVNLAEMANNFPNIDTKVSVGGPVQTESIFFIHMLGEQLPGSVKITDQLFMGGDYPLLVSLLNEGKINPN